MIYRSCYFIQNIDEITDCIHRCIANGSTNEIIGVIIFTNASSAKDFDQFKRDIEFYCEKYVPSIPVGVLSQSVGDNRIALEMYVHQGSEKPVRRRYNQFKYSVFEDELGVGVFAPGIACLDPLNSFSEQSHFSLKTMQGVLEQEGMTMDDVVRQWNTLPDILKTIDADGNKFQHYQLFNELRQLYYQRYKRENQYPAATGIGMKYGTVTIDFLAYKRHKGVSSSSIDNPYQVKAYQYGQEVLVGIGIVNPFIKRTPLFERAKLLSTTKFGQLFISGTASIRGEYTIGSNDLVKQTKLTIENIKKLVSKKNLASAGLIIKTSDYSYLRVYVKYHEDMEVVKQLCSISFGSTPILCVQADICRDDLLVEIEGDMLINH